MDIEALERLAQLKDSGALTKEEFDLQKRRIFSDGADVTDGGTPPTVRRFPRRLMALAGISLVTIVALLSWLSFGGLRDPTKVASAESQSAKRKPVVDNTNGYSVVSKPIQTTAASVDQKAAPIDPRYNDLPCCTVLRADSVQSGS